MAVNGPIPRVQQQLQTKGVWLSLLQCLNINTLKSHIHFLKQSQDKELQVYHMCKNLRKALADYGR